MSVQSITQPEKVINGQVLKWNAVFHPMTFEAQRVDAAVDMRYNPSTLSYQTIIRVQGTDHLNLS